MTSLAIRSAAARKAARSVKRMKVARTVYRETFSQSTAPPELTAVEDCSRRPAVATADEQSSALSFTPSERIASTPTPDLASAMHSLAGDLGA